MANAAATRGTILHCRRQMQGSDIGVQWPGWCRQRRQEQAYSKVFRITLQIKGFIGEINPAHLSVSDDIRFAKILRFFVTYYK